MCKTVSQIATLKHTRKKKIELAVIFPIFHANTQIFSKVIVLIIQLQFFILLSFLGICHSVKIFVLCKLGRLLALNMLRMWRNSFWWFSKCCKYNRMCFCSCWSQGQASKTPIHQMKWLLKAGKRNFSYQVAWCNPLQLPKKFLSRAAAPKVFIMILNLLNLAAELQK